VEGGLVFASIVVNSQSSCAVTPAGAAYCWGAQGDGGLRSSDPPVIHEFPVLVPGGLTFASLAAGEYHVCGLTTSGSAYCWGFNAYGQIGDGTTIDRETVTAVSGGHTFATLTAGYYRTCGLTTTGAAYCWGYDGNHPFGTYANPRPLAVGGPNFTTLAVGFDHTCGVADGGTIFCWGNNDSGQLGDGTTVSKTSPVAVKNP
jgi:alpha-tubulin suppressor-like RCC1 family protein